MPGMPQGPHEEGSWSRQPPGGQQGYQPFMFWSLYSIFFPSSLGWILRGNSRCVNSFPSSSGLRNACRTKQRAQLWCQEQGPASIAHPLGWHRPPGTPTPHGTAGTPACWEMGSVLWGGGNISCSNCNASRERCRSLQGTLLSYTQRRGAARGGHANAEQGVWGNKPKRDHKEGNFQEKVELAQEEAELQTSLGPGSARSAGLAGRRAETSSLRARPGCSHGLGQGARSSTEPVPGHPPAPAVSR